MFTRLTLVLACLVGAAAPAGAVDRPHKKHANTTFSTGEKVCDNLSLSALTGKSPWLVIGAGGAYQYWTADEAEREKLGFFAHPAVWGTLLVLVLLVAFKDSILSAFSYLKTPLNALAEAFHATGGVFGLIYLGTVAFGGDPNATPDSATASVAGLFAVEPEPSAASRIGDFFLWVCMCGVHTAVWIVFNTVEVVILLSPFPFVDTALKAGRTALIGVITAAAQIHPVFGFVLALPVIVVSVLLVPIALRFGIVGWVFTVDILKRMFGIKPPASAPLRAFASWHMPGVRLYTFGVIEPGPNGHEFVFRRLFFLWKKRVPIPSEKLVVAKGTLTPALIMTGSNDQPRTLLRFPPRYRGVELDVAKALALEEVIDGSLLTSLKTSWRQFKVWLFRNQVPQGTST